MKRILNYPSVQEFNKDFTPSNDKVYSFILEGISQAVTEKKKLAHLFSVEFEDDDHSYQVTLPKEDWSVTLEQIKDALHKKGKFDEALDTYLLEKTVKEYVSSK